MKKVLVLASLVALIYHLSWVLPEPHPHVSDGTALAASRDVFRTAQSNTQAKTVEPAFAAPQHTAPNILIGLDADMSSASAESGEAIRRGIVLALDGINRNGGVLGRRLELVVRDHRGNPGRGIDNMLAFAQMNDLVAVVGGIHTPVALEELERSTATNSSISGPGQRAPR